MDSTYLEIQQYTGGNGNQEEPRTPFFHRQHAGQGGKHDQHYQYLRCGVKPTIRGGISGEAEYNICEASGIQEVRHDRHRQGP